MAMRYYIKMVKMGASFLNNSILANLPKVDELLEHPALGGALHTLPYPTVLEAVRSSIEAQRSLIIKGEAEAVLPVDAIAQQALALAVASSQPCIRRVINATGIILHTNLGRAPISRAALHEALAEAGGYCTLEYNLESGERGRRGADIEKLLTKLTGAESALIVNNNASAVFLALHCLANDGGVLISRGELVEIGGSFRVPDIITESGAHLVEVGTTNKTHISDYKNALKTADIRAVLKVHTSNYRICGFAEDVPPQELASLAHAHNLPLVYDIGSGALDTYNGLKLSDEPTVVQGVKAGADVICFSGDKLLGGTQAGIIVGKKELLDTMRKSPFYRMLRCDKISLAVLGATLKLYLEPSLALRKVPALAMLTAPKEVLKVRAKALLNAISNACESMSCELLDDFGQVGGGAMPTVNLPAITVALQHNSINTGELERRLRLWKTPIITRIKHGSVLLDVRTLEDEDFAEIANAVAKITTEQR